MHSLFALPVKASETDLLLASAIAEATTLFKEFDRTDNGELPSKLWKGRAGYKVASDRWLELDELITRTPAESRHMAEEKADYVAIVFAHLGRSGAFRGPIGALQDLLRHRNG